MLRSVAAVALGSALLALAPACGRPSEGLDDPVGAFVAAIDEGGEESEAVRIDADPARSGTVTSWLGVERAPARVKVGDRGAGWLAVRHRAIFDFDTSVLPDGATLLGLLLGFSVVDDGLPDDTNAYFERHLRAEIAPAGGFGGSPALSYGDYSAPAAASAPFAYNPAIGFPIMPPEVLTHVDPTGPTQIRLAFADNPEGRLASFSLAEAGLEPFIVVVYREGSPETCPGGEPPPCEPEERWVREAADFGSSSPYGPYAFLMRRFAGPAGTRAVRVSFAAFDTEEGRDRVTLRDDRWTAVHSYSGALGPFVSHEVPGSSVTVVFQADGSGSGAGFRLDAVEFLVD